MKLLNVVACALAGVAALASPSYADPVAGTVTLNLSQTTRTDGKVDVSLTWSTEPRANGCVSTGDWTGSRSSSRSNPLIFTGVTPPKQYTLECRWDDTDAKLTWTAPTQNVDGTPLTDLAGYKIYYGNSPTNLDNMIDLNNAGLTGSDVTNLAAGVWHFAMTAYNAQGKESAKSATVSTTLGSATSAATQQATVSIPVPKAPTAIVVTP